MLATAQAACWLVLAGYELIKKKAEIGRGEWLPWIEANCEYSTRTAQNYMGLAEGIAARAKKKNAALGDMRAEDFHALLDKSAGTLDDGEQLRLLKAVHGLTGEETIRQLYLDFGIIKEPKRLGGARTKGEEKETAQPRGMSDADWARYQRMDEPEREAFDLLTPLFRDIEHLVFGRQLQNQAAKHERDWFLAIKRLFADAELGKAKPAAASEVKI